MPCIQVHMIAEIIAAGSEMLSPFRQDTNSLYLTAGLNDLGVTVAFKTIVGDNLEHLTGAARVAFGRADIVIFSGGLGPTEDDLTREAVSAALGVPLHPEPTIITALYKRFAERRMTMPPNNAKQADVLEGAEMLPNANGSAPGQFLVIEREGKRRFVMLLPGPPREQKPMWDGQVKPRLKELLPESFLARRVLRIALLPESAVDARTSPVYKQYPDVETTILFHLGEIQLHFQTAAATMEAAQARVDEVCGRVEHEIGDDVFSSQGEGLEEVVLLMLGMRHQTLATAESMTGGLLAQRLTAVPNSSRSFVGGAVTYSGAAKTQFCRVPKELIEREGSVSEPVARVMAEGVLAATGASFGVAITGLAGPGGGTGRDEGKPVGLVYVALAGEGETEVKEVRLTGDRERIRWFASQHGLDMVRRRLQ